MIIILQFIGPEKQNNIDSSRVVRGMGFTVKRKKHTRKKQTIKR